MGKTSIEWTEHSVNPIRARLRDYKDHVGHYCVKLSPGCKNCYASRMQPRFGLPVFAEQRGELEPELFLDDKVLDSVRRRKKPTTYFWCDMTDLFGEWVPRDWIIRCFAVMAETPHHTHQVLTKRAKRMREVLTEIGGLGKGPDGKAHTRGHLHWGVAGERPWPLPNVILMVSAENQATADERIPELLATPAAVRGVSAEPLLGPLDLAPWFGKPEPALGWLIVGGESGPGARPFDLAWARELVQQCRGAAVPCFVKQLGRRPVGDWSDSEPWPARLSSKGGDMSEWPEDLRVRQMPRRQAA